MTITTVLVIKLVLNFSLRALQDFVDPIIQLAELTGYCPGYYLVSQQTKAVNIIIKTATPGKIPHLIIDISGLKALSEV
ncbi:transposase [Salmonella enterica subsp. enterica serovar Wedding]|nr:transposase [Salmonella enterica subsp. enterica serovar Wedding]